MPTCDRQRVVRSVLFRSSRDCNMLELRVADPYTFAQVYCKSTNAINYSIHCDLWVDRA